MQRYFCKDCKRKFAGIDTIPKMQYPTSQIADALNMYYEAMSLNEIRRNLIQQHNSYISDATALNWVRRFSKPVIIEANKYKPDVGRVADETGKRHDKSGNKCDGGKRLKSLRKLVIPVTCG